MTGLLAASRRVKRLALLGFLLVLAAWFAAYVFVPRLSFANGPFYAEDFPGSAADLVPGSRAPLTLLGRILFVLEVRHTAGERPRAVFVLTAPDGRIAWARSPIMDFGPIEILPDSARWHVAGGWVVGIKPAYHEAGRLYLSPLGGLRYFFHNW